ncbi:MAG: carboxypeptidase-like regulatory domain-containing protein [Terracidiphilus sp.]|jgi:hypothetical protein
MIHRLHFVLLVVLISVGSAPLYGVTLGSVSGSVRDSAGTPQIGAEVQLLRPDLSVLASVYTDESGRFTFPKVMPGHYAIKAIGAWFLPSLREDLRVRTNTVVNLTLNSLYEAMQWLPAEPRAGNAQKDDWAWTLRSAANRPLLRWLEDGPLVVISDSSGGHPKLKARLMATGQEGVFGESGERISSAIQETPSNSRELLARVDFAPGSNADIESMLGFRQDLGLAGSVQSVAAISVHPEMMADGQTGLVEADLRSWESMRLGDEFEAEAGSDQVLGRLSGPSRDTAIDLLPFASLAWRDGSAAIRYHMSTSLPPAPESEDTDAGTWLAPLSLRDGALVIEHGNHQELGWERLTDHSGVAVLVYNDRVDNPVVEAHGRFAAGDSEATTVLADPLSGLLHAAGPNFSAAGVAASFEHGLPGGTHFRLSYAAGDALIFSALPATSPAPDTMAQLLASLHPHRAQACSLSLSGILDGTGTRWQASYRWQPEDTVTPVAPFALGVDDPYLNLHLHQPIHLRHDGTGGLHLDFDVRNLLAQGYRTYLLSDGSLLIFAQQPRGISAGLAFNF